MAYNVDDFNRILADINAKIDSLAADGEENAVLISSLKNAFDNKNNVEIERLEEFSDDLNELRSLLENSPQSGDYRQMLDELKNLQQTFRTEIMNMAFDKNSVLENIKDDIVKVFEKSAFLEELYPAKNSEKIEIVRNAVCEKITEVQNNIDAHIKTDYEMLAQAIGALYGVIEKSKNEMKDELKNSTPENLTTYISQILYGVNNFSQLLNSFKENVSSNLSEYLTSINSALGEFVENIQNSQGNLREELIDDYAQKIENLSDDLSDRLNTCFTNQSSEMKAVNENIIFKIDTVSDILNNVSAKADEISLNIRTNLSNQIGDLKTDILSISGSVDKAKDEMIHSSNENLSQIMTGINDNSRNINDFKENVAVHLSEYLSAIKDALKTFSEELSLAQDGLRSEIIDNQAEELQKLLADVEKLDADLAQKDVNYKCYIDEKIDEIHNYLVNLEDMLSSSSIGVENSIKEKISQLEELVNKNSSYKDEKLDIIAEKVDIAGVVLENVSGKTDEQISTIKEIKTLISSVFEEIQKNQETIQSDLSLSKDNSKIIEEGLCEKLRVLETSLAELSNNHKFDTDEKFVGITSLISELKDLLEHTSRSNFNELSDKIAYIQTGFNESFSIYESNINALQEKLGEYTKAADQIYVLTNSKLDGSLAEVLVVKENVEEIYNKIISADLDKVVGLDNKFDEILSTFGGITENIEDLKGNFTENVKSVIKDNIDFVDNGLSFISQNLYEIKENLNDGSNLLSINEFEEKIALIKDELSLIHTDIVEAVKEKGEALSREFAPVMEAADKYLAFGFEELVEEIKNQIQLSYLNLLSELNENLTDNQDAYLKIESTYKDIVARCSALESSIADFTSNNMELMSATLSAVDNNVKANLDKTNQMFDQWQASFDELGKAISENRSDYRHSLADLLDEIDKTLEEKLLLNQKDLQDYMALLWENPKFVQLIESSSQDTAQRFEELKLQISEGFALQDNSELTESVKKILHDSIQILNDKFTIIDTKIDILSQADNTEILDEIEETSEKVILSLKELNDKIDKYSDSNNLNEIKSVNSDCEEIRKSLSELHSKVDILAMNDNTELEDDISDVSERLMGSLNELHAKVDILAMSDSNDYTDNFAELSETLSDAVSKLQEKLNNISTSHDDDINAGLKELSEKIMSSLAELQTKTDVLAMSDNSDLSDAVDGLAENIDNASEKILDDINKLHQKVDILAMSDNSEIQDDIDEIKDIIRSQQKLFDSSLDDEISAKLEDIIQTLCNSDDKIAKTLELLHNKVDILAMTDDSDIKDEIQDIKDLIERQKDYFKNDENDEKSAEITTHLEKLISEINKIEKNISELDLEKNSQDIKDSVMTAMLSAMDQVSFVEETEEIKDFVEEKTNAINQTLLEVKKQLNNISNSGDDMDLYSYTLQDVESDIAKLRLTLNELSSSTASTNEFGVISNNIGKIAKAIEQLQAASVSHMNNADLKTDFSKLSEDILSLSTRTNKILLDSNESQRIMNLSLKEFENRTEQLQTRLDEIDNKEIDSRLSLIEQKVDESVSSTNILRNVMIYLGEWMDDTSQTISSIYDKSSKAASTHKLIEDLKLAVPNEAELVKAVEKRFEEQELRIDRLEQKLEKALDLLSGYDENIINAKIDRIDKHLEKLTGNIEKLTAYVDEE